LLAEILAGGKISLHLLLIVRGLSSNYILMFDITGAVLEVLTTKAQKAHEGNIDAKF